MDKERMTEFAKELVKEAERLAEEQKATQPKKGSLDDLISMWFGNPLPNHNPKSDTERLNAILPYLFADVLELTIEEQMIALWHLQWSMCSRIPGWLARMEELIAKREEEKQEATKE